MVEDMSASVIFMMKLRMDIEDNKYNLVTFLNSSQFKESTVTSLRVMNVFIQMS